MSSFCSSIFHPIILTKETSLPQLFTYPFYYTPDPLCILAATKVQNYLEHQTDFDHNFGLNPKQNGLIIGKMFGVMVVKNTANELGFIAAFSGKIAEQNYIKGFVPPIFDTLEKSGFYKIGEDELNKINAAIESLEGADSYIEAIKNIAETRENALKEINAYKAFMKTEKLNRDKTRNLLLNEISDIQVLERLKTESIRHQIVLKQLKQQWDIKINEAVNNLEKQQCIIDDLRQKRKAQSALLQSKIHEQYNFLNAKGETRNLLSIFTTTNAIIPPAGAGECAAPKLFQYAYNNQLQPIAMAEFWWGASPKSEVRKHKQFYPSCRSKCEPILGFMLQGLAVEKNPIQQEIIYNKPLEILFEDASIVIINKPHEFLSVPGKSTAESVYTRMKAYLPQATGPLLVHRLDMSTSGILLIAKNEAAYKFLQLQFIKRSIKKRYVALLDGILKESTGTITLPLRVDLDNRPQQLVCYEYGKMGITQYEVLTIENSQTRVYFYPLTGRTHQLRVHAAHGLGLNAPILGDDLYGTKADRLYLHAEQLSFIHPTTKQMFTINSKSPF